jgi:GntR family transcriptional regulator, rspAB operon transcriptional repressor
MNKDETIKNRIYKEMRRLIIMGHRKPGERFEVEEIASSYSTSVTPVRDALQMLSQEGLVTIKPRSGYYVAGVTLKELRDMLELRKILEVAAVERAVFRITDEQIDAMHNVHAGYTGDDDESYDRYTDENRRFHYILAEASGNYELAEMLGHLLDRLARFMVIRHAGKVQDANHLRIVEALQKRDLPASRQALIDELDASRDTILDGVMQEESAHWSVNGYR